MILGKGCAQPNGNGMADWKIEEEAGKNVLSVTNSDDGGFTRIGTHWTNYIFSFDTRIINKYSSWLVRVKDRYNYLMFQCKVDCIVPHIRINRVWEVCDPIDLNNTLMLNTWYTVSIKVRGNIVEIQINDNDVRYTIPSTTTPNLPKLYVKGNKRVIFDTDLVSGRVGFREYGSEKALFRKVKVITIH